MAEKTGIKWTDATWNATTGCDHVSAGCNSCYAEALALRLQKMDPNGKYKDGFAVRLHPKALTLPLKWRKPSKVFVNSMSDQFHVQVPDDFTDQMFAVMALCPEHIFQVLTKRPGRAVRYLNNPERLMRVHRAAQRVYAENPGLRSKLDAKRPPILTLEESVWPLPNVWMGTSVEDQSVAHRIDALLECDAAVRFLSCEPLIGPLDLNPYLWEEAGPDWAGSNLRNPGIDWVITGGESGQGFRPLDLDWVRTIRDQCVYAEVAFFHKQGSGFKSGQHRELDGRTWDQFPMTPAEREAQWQRETGATMALPTF